MLVRYTGELRLLHGALLVQQFYKGDWFNFVQEHDVDPICNELRDSVGMGDVIDKRAGGVRYIIP
jgi:hypothetical protein